MPSSAEEVLGGEVSDNLPGFCAERAWWCRNVEGPESS
jgi:hypothetical protein